MIVISLTSCIGANGNGGNVRGASVIAVVAAAACGGAAPGLAPDSAPAQPLAAHADGHFDGAALGWTLGSEVHLFVADSAFTQQIYDSLLRPRLGAKAPVPSMLTLAADHIPTPPGMPGYYDATILFPGGASPAPLAVVRLHQSGRCSAAGGLVEVVERLSPAGAPHVPLAVN